MSSKNKSIVYGSVTLLPDEFDPKNVKVRITTLIDEDVLLGLKSTAREVGKKYQTLLNQVLRSFVEGQQTSETRRKGKRGHAKSLTEERVREIVRSELKKKKVK